MNNVAKTQNDLYQQVGYYGSNCASVFGVTVPVFSVQTVPLVKLEKIDFSVRFVPVTEKANRIFGSNCATL